MKSTLFFVCFGLCISVVTFGQVGPPSGGGANCIITCEPIVDFFTYVQPAPANGAYPHFAFLQADGPCKRLWRIDSMLQKAPSGDTCTKRYASVPDDVPPCAPLPADDSALTTQVSFVTAPSQTWTTVCYKSCVSGE